jgi:hypothetical protein
MTLIELLMFALAIITLNILGVLKKIYALSCKCNSTASIIEFYFEKRKVTNMNLKVNQNLPVSIEIKDKFGNPAIVDGVPSWSLTAQGLADLEVAADGMSALVKPIGPVGSVSVQVSADADLGAGVTAILGELAIELIAGDAETIAIAAGTPVNA